MGLSKTEKERQLIELSMIVTGIQLFNKASEDADPHELSTTHYQYTDINIKQSFTINISRDAQGDNFKTRTSLIFEN